MNLLERLKIETRPAHDRIERAVDLHRHTATLARYRGLLGRFYGFHRAWEEAAGGLISDQEFFRRRCKVERIVRDLRMLGMRPDEIAQLPRCHPLMPLSEEAAAWGSMYVIEGSTLGGAVIAHAVETRLGLDAEKGCAYFRSYGRETAMMWRSFGEKLLEFASPRVDDTVVASAQRTFEVMQDWLSGIR